MRSKRPLKRWRRVKKIARPQTLGLWFWLGGTEKAVGSSPESDSVELSKTQLTAAKEHHQTNFSESLRAKGPACAFC